jgi:pimeloyl-ACP methyl ester carboxylesterase
LPASDALGATAAAGFESTADDLLAVLDAADSDRATIFDLDFGTAGVVFAATYPERVRSLIIAHLRPSFPELRGFSAEQRLKMARALVTTRTLRSENPRVAHDPVLQRWWGRVRRLQSSPMVKARLMELAADHDIESTLASVRAPALVLHRQGNRVFDVATSRAATARMPNARFVEVPGSELAIFLGDTAPVLATTT